MQTSASVSAQCRQGAGRPVLNRSHGISTGAWRRAAPVPRVASSRGMLVCRATAGLAPETKQMFDDLVSSHKVLVFIKGTKQFPQCGFSNTVVQILRSLDVPFESVNVLADERVRSGMKEYSQWPTFPQVYINGDFYGGCDIMIESYNSGELKEVLEVALNS